MSDAGVQGYQPPPFRFGGRGASPLVAHADVFEASITANAAALAAAVLSTLIPPGVIWEYGGSAAPTGWLMCDGTSYLRTDWPALFTALGGASSPWGLPDGTHFNVPDLRGRAPVGVGTGSGLTARALADQVGAETVVLSLAQTPQHAHPFRAGVSNNSGDKFPIVNGGSQNADSMAGGQTAQDGTAAIGLNAGGGSNAHANMQPSLALSFIVKT